MKFLTFHLSGATAFFKRPDVNSVCYFTYGNIHRAALLGLFGAVLGLPGYGWTRGKKEIVYPAYYEKLKNLQLGIAPGHGICRKKIQTFNNSVGYASFEQGGNLIVKEQWLEHPSWDIYVVVDNEMSEKLASFLLQGKCVYIPYLGKNEHPADISDVRVVEGEKIHPVASIDSLFEKEKAVLAERDGSLFYYEENLPWGLMPNGMYELRKMVQTDAELISYEGMVVQIEGRAIAIQQ